MKKLYFFIFCFYYPAIAQPTRDLNINISVNQIGYLNGAVKKCVASTNRDSVFHVVDTEHNKIVFTGKLLPQKKDFGTFSVGDFSMVVKDGVYYLRTRSGRSWPFRIGTDVYNQLILGILVYFQKQRCGPSTTGYLAPCHLDDGIRLDNGRHVNVTGGWHDASDLRKWVGATIFGMIGLGQLYDMNLPGIDKTLIQKELLWGNRYFLNMQDSAGYVMSHVGGDVLEHGDSNRWTDNIPGKGGEIKTVDAPQGGSTSRMTVAGSCDDRVIQTRPLDRIGQNNFIAVEAQMSRIMRGVDPEYAESCLDAAERCFDWCQTTGKDENAGELGSAVAAVVELYRATDNEFYKAFVITKTKRLYRIQEKSKHNDAVQGFFHTSLSDTEPHRDIKNGPQHIIAMCDLLELFPKDEYAPMWREMVSLYTKDYLNRFSQHNAFGIVPFGLFSRDPGGQRLLDIWWYRYFMVPQDWWVGINANLASAGVALVRAARVLEEPALLEPAQRQLDWILGVNPFNASTVVGFGHNHPLQFINGTEFRPPTPVLHGAVMNGLGGTMEDLPDKYDGSYHTAEYWTPMVGYTLWLAGVLSEEK
ncbi:glycoside hydrolase family 9 protein [candidate division KSB1 bacterium]|nr:glycoside hydrolase family 9 protein [candidate division KSB1 bacterium]